MIIREYDGLFMENTTFSLSPFSLTKKIDPDKYYEKYTPPKQTLHIHPTYTIYCLFDFVIVVDS